MLVKARSEVSSKESRHRGSCTSAIEYLGMLQGREVIFLGRGFPSAARLDLGTNGIIRKVKVSCTDQTKTSRSRLPKRSLRRIPLVITRSVAQSYPFSRSPIVKPDYHTPSLPSFVKTTDATLDKLST